MQALTKMTWVELKLKLREPVGTFFTLVFPLLLLFLFGSIYGNDPSPFLGGRGNVDNSVPGYIAMIIGTTGMIGLPIALSVYREQGILRRFRAAPITPGLVLGSQVAVNLVVSLVGMAFLIIVGIFVYDLVLPEAPVGAFLAVVFSGLSFLSVGFVLASLIPTATAAQAVGMALFFPMMFLSGAALPQQMLPEKLVAFSQYLPLTHVVNLLQDLWYGDGWNLTAVLVLAGMMAAATAVSIRYFRWE
ncbi:MAG: ABC transporter permease [Chloroflexi bacterium]|nr:ABC transporter permease [Chloroflexota bacterium]